MMGAVGCELCGQGWRGEMNEKIRKREDGGGNWGWDLEKERVVMRFGGGIGRLGKLIY